MRLGTIPLDPPDRLPWGPGLTVAGLSAALTTLAVVAFGLALAQVHPLLAIVVNLVAVGGGAPTLVRWRTIAVIRWVVYGLAAGVMLGWLGLLFAALG